jgi:hypothetical protein
VAKAVKLPRHPLRLLFLLALLLAGCHDDCLKKDKDGTCLVTCTIWQGDTCVHSCTKGIPCD